MTLAADPRSAYLHVPFCARRCGYCNFAVVAGRDDLQDAYLKAIAFELASLGRPRPVDTLYFGGGTPTQLALSRFEDLCRVALQWFELRPGYEWTVEANPLDVTPELIDVLGRHGVNRVSLGGQSFEPGKLALLERDHTPQQVPTAVTLLRQAGISVALDLIFAAPGESLEAWQADVAAALRLAPQHLSTYGLTIEKGTSFWTRQAKGKLEELDEEVQRSMYLHAIDALTDAGFEHYEVSNFARPGCRSRHNEAYWAGVGYFAAGPGATRYVDGVRQTNHRSTTTYIKRVLRGEAPVAESETLLPENRARERLVFGLRRLEGVRRDAFHAATGYTIEGLAGPAIDRFVELGVLHSDAERVRLTREGLLVSDSLWPDLL